MTITTIIMTLTLAAAHLELVFSLCYLFLLFPPMPGRVGQIMDDELFSNECGSSNFNNFLNLLGDCVQLKVILLVSNIIVIIITMTNDYFLHQILLYHY